MSNLQSDERIKQMSKQEEILFKRKREIENKLKSQNIKLGLETPVPKVVEEDNSFSLSNKFSNDGSFFEQFKKLANSKNKVKTESNEESYESPNRKLNDYKPNVSLQYNYEPHKSGDFPSIMSCRSPVKEENTNVMMQNADPGILKQEVKNEPAVDQSHADWFQDALKRVKEKALEISSGGPSAVSLSDQEQQKEMKKKRSRWGEMSQASPSLSSAGNAPLVAVPQAVSVTQQTNFNMPNVVMDMVGEGQHMEAIQGIMISKLTRSNPAILSYAMRVFGSLDLTDAQWKQCEEQMKMNIVFQLLQERKREVERLESEGKVKYEYDSDEDCDGGTWEHKRRKKEMSDTAMKAEELTRGAEGKHHIGDFLPPEELANFMEKYTALKEGRDPDLSDYRDNRLTEDNVGYRMLKSMGWTEGTGLGAEGKGITNPVNQKAKAENQGLGAGAANNLSFEDDEYDAYRKRMMLAYRFRPNPLNNPRRAYY